MPKNFARRLRRLAVLPLRRPNAVLLAQLLQTRWSLRLLSLHPSMQAKRLRSTSSCHGNCRAITTPRVSLTSNLWADITPMVQVEVHSIPLGIYQHFWLRAVTTTLWAHTGSYGSVALWVHVFTYVGKVHILTCVSISRFPAQLVRQGFLRPTRGGDTSVPWSGSGWLPYLTA